MSVEVISLFRRDHLLVNVSQKYYAESKTIVDKFTVTNTSLAAAAFSCHIASSGDAAVDGNLIIQNKQVLAGQTYSCPEMIGQVLDPDDIIYTSCDSGTALAASAAGRKIN